MSVSLEQQEKVVNHIWGNQVLLKALQPVDRPKGYVLGGQPGAGKSGLIKRIREQEKQNILVINGDEFRQYHPQFDEIQAAYGKDAPKYTAEFAGKITERLIEKALNEKLNIAVEGTFRTADTPLKTLSDMKQHGYETAVYIMTTDAKVSWLSTLERYEKMQAAGEAPRYTDKAHHDLVVRELPKNADQVYQSGLADAFHVYNREGLLSKNELPSKAIEKELYQYNNTRVVVDSKSIAMEYKPGDTWKEIEKTPNDVGVKAGVYMLGLAKPSERSQSYDGEIVFKDSLSAFQKTKEGLIRHTGVSEQIKLGQKYSITKSENNSIQVKAVASQSRSMKR